MSIIDVPTSTTTAREPERNVGVDATTTYLSGTALPSRVVTLTTTTDLWYRAWLEGSLNALLALPPGWDGGRAPMITEQSVAGLVDVLQTVLTPSSVPPQLVPLPDGGVQAEWLVAGDNLEIEVAGNGDAHFFAVDNDGVVAVDGRADAATVAAAARRLSRLSARAATVG
jgi:hypothetical protein